MERAIRICVDDFIVPAVLNHSHTARLIWDALPIEGQANLWGDEIYFSIPVEADLEETAQEVVEQGDLGYWPTGTAFCIFFGPTHMSQGDEIRPASAVNMIGTVIGDPQLFKGVPSGATVRLEK